MTERIEGRWLPVGHEFEVRSDAVELAIIELPDGGLRVTAAGCDGRLVVAHTESDGSITFEPSPARVEVPA